jgi:FlaG/FlaF family flagellin (archaellin)
MILKNGSLNTFYHHRRRLARAATGVSEAIGTIILLAIAITLIGVVAVWVETLPEIAEQKQAELQLTTPQRLTTGQMTIDINHKGGDSLKGEDTEIRILFLYPTYLSSVLSLSDSGTSDLTDDEWSIGEHWNYTLTGVPVNAELEISVVDMVGGRLLMREEILLGKLEKNLPDLEITPSNITIGEVDETIRKNRPTTITAVVYNLGTSNVSAIVRFFDENRIISTGGAQYTLIKNIPYKITPLTQNFKVVNITWIPDRWGVHNIHVKLYSTQYETNYANNYASKQATVELPFEPPKGPDLSISEYDIQPTTQYPLHGQDLNISIIIHNLGDLSIKNGEEFNATVTLGNQTIIRLFKNGFRSRDSMEFFVMFYEIGPGGPAEITVELDPEDEINEITTNNNRAVRQIQIMPTILVVDDDGADSGKKNVANILMNSLKGRGINYDYYNVKGVSDVNPRFNDGPKKLSNFDIVIWVTGYQWNNTLLPENLENLKTWLDVPTTNNSLWLIGHDVLNSTVASPGISNGSDFAWNYLGVNTYKWDGTPEFLYGVDSDPITDGMILNTSNYIVDEDRGLNLTLRPAGVNENISGILTNTDIMGPNNHMALRYHNLSLQFKVVLFSFEFSSIVSPYDLSNVSYHVLKWFNYSLEEGYDFGVVEQEFSNLNPEFMDIINVTATIVNNGPTTELVYVMFYVTDPYGQEYSMGQYPDGVANPKEYSIPGKGGRIKVTKAWLAVAVGDHNFRVMVDPFDHFKEIVEENNDFSYYGLEVTTLKIQYTILVVDDDNSTNNGGIYQDTSTPIINSLKDLDYYHIRRIVSGGALPGDGPNLDVLKHYNSVLWLTGNDAGPTLTPTDQKNLGDYIAGRYEEAKYLRTKVNLLLVGQNILDDINGSGNNIVPDPGFVKDYLRVTEYSTGKGLVIPLKGIANNPVSHGLNYPLVKGFPDTSDIVVTTDSNNYLFKQNEVLKTYNSINYERNNSRVVFLPWELSFVDNTVQTDAFGINETYRNELIFLIMNWFEYPLETAELKISSIDINISDDKPNIGNSYIIKTEIYNHGPISCSSIIRYFDGNSIIDTDTIYIPKKGKSSSEIIWVPHFAGNRTITVYADVDNDVPEVFEVLNNDASVRDLWVYFFYDDLEDGLENWDHESTIIRINAESELDYMDRPVHSNLTGTWNTTDGFSANSSIYHSADVSFYAGEPTGETAKSDVLLVLVIDDSASMVERTDGWGNTWLDLAKDACKYLVDQISDWSKVCIWHFKGNNEERELSFTRLEGAGRATVYNAIDSLSNPSGTTILWDAIGEGYIDMITALPTNQDLTPVMVALSDGMDLQASDKSGLKLINAESKIEGGSNVWSPWHEIYKNNDTLQGFKSINYNLHYGKYTIDWADLSNTTIWFEAMSKGSMQHTRRGLLNSEIPIFTIGLGLEHHEPPNKPTVATWPGNGVSDNVNATCNDTSKPCIETGTLEYNLWRIATSSDAEYFYAPTADELKGIFKKIAMRLTTLLTRSARDLGIGVEAKYALTETFSLLDVGTARLTFYHKFALSEGYNGAVVRAGIPNATGDWIFSYLEPIKLYNGNFFLKRTAYDDFGKPMLWCWNGISDNGKFNWEYAEFDLSEFIGQPRVRLNFTLVLYGGGIGGGWWLDDVEVKVSRNNTQPVTNASRDQWALITEDSHSGKQCWWNGNPSTQNFSGGLDNSLYTRLIDLTNARNATLSTYFKFNINMAAGRPPDGFRVEISSDNGVSWDPINFGSRAAWGVSGNDTDNQDNKPNDGKSYTGIDSGDNWVEAGSLTRLNCDLTGWGGKVIRLRFRVVTAKDTNPYFGDQHYQQATAGFGGFYVDDVVIHGFSLLG